MKIWLETNISAHDFINEGYWRANFELVKNLLPDASISVYDDNNVLHGFVGLVDNYIAGLFVNSKSQSKGIGKALLDHVKETHSELSLQVYKSNARAVKFYIREGFIVKKEQIDVNTGKLEFVMNWMK